MGQSSFVISNPDGSLTIQYDKSIYSLAALKKAAYKFTDRVSVFINEEADNQFRLQFTFLNASDEETKQRVVHDFCNEVLDQDLRESIATQTEATRLLILAEAFSKAPLLG